jgi:phosphoribosylglycinamide formyltransferase-1
MSFVSEPLTPLTALYDAAGPSRGEPALPAGFRWREESLDVAAVRRTWRSTKDDRGDTYLKRHWYEIALRDGRTAVVYFDRGARRGTPRWWLYTLDDRHTGAAIRERLTRPDEGGAANQSV